MHFAEVQYGVTVEPDNMCSRTSQTLAIELVVGDNDGISDSTFIGFLSATNDMSCHVLLSVAV